MAEEEFRIFAGVDWATESHQVCVALPDGRVLEERAVAHEATALSALADRLTELAGGNPAAVAVGIEVPHGAVVETLLERGLVLFALNPKQLDRFRDRYTVAGAKDDRRDARGLADALRTDRRAFTRVALPAPVLIELREETRLHEELREQSHQASNRLHQQLHRFYPQLLQLAEATEPWLWALWELVPTPAAAATVRASRIERLLRHHRIRRLDAAAVLAQLRTPALHVAPGTVEAAGRHITVLVAQLRLLHGQRQDCQRRLATLLERAAAESTPSSLAARPQHSDVEIILSMPGAGTLVTATMLADAGALLATRAHSTLRAVCGIAPVTIRSAKVLTVVRRYACNPHLRDACHYWGHNAVLTDARCRQQYAALRAKGHSHGRALRGVMDRMLEVLMALLRDRTLYDPNRRLPNVQAA
jgi:transposase